MPSSFTFLGTSVSSYWLETNVGEVYLAHEVQVGLKGYFKVKYVGIAGLNWKCYAVLDFIPV